MPLFERRQARFHLYALIIVEINVLVDELLRFTTAFLALSYEFSEFCIARQQSTALYIVVAAASRNSKKFAHDLNRIFLSAAIDDFIFCDSFHFLPAA